MQKCIIWDLFNPVQPEVWITAVCGKGMGCQLPLTPKYRTMEEACIVLLDGLHRLGTKEDGNASQFLSLME